MALGRARSAPGRSLGARAAPRRRRWSASLASQRGQRAGGGDADRATCCRRRTPTAASAPRPASRRSALYSGLGGARAGGRGPRTRRTSAAAGTACSATSAPGAGARIGRRVARADDPRRCERPGCSASSFGGRDLLARARSATSGQTARSPTRSTSPRSRCWRCARPASARPRRRSAWLERQQDRDGGFNFATRRRQRATSTTPARRSRRSGAGDRRASPAPRCRLHPRASRTATAAFPSSRAASRTRSRPRGRSRGCSRPGVDPARCTAPGRRRRSRYLQLADRRRRARALLALERPDARCG